MIDRLRALWNRPIADHERLPAFFVAAAIVLVAAVILYVTRPDDTTSSSSSSATTSTTVAPAIVPAEPTPTVTQAPPGTPQANAPFAPPVSAEAAMRTFLKGYLPYLYGQGEAGGIDRASRELVQRLAANPPRVSPAQQERHPSVVEIRSRRPRGDRVQLIATIDAGETSRYPIGAQLVKRSGRWVVTAILNDE